MDKDELAQQLLVARIHGYVSANPTGFPSSDVVVRWYKECWRAAIAAANADLS